MFIHWENVLEYERILLKDRLNTDKDFHPLVITYFIGFLLRFSDQEWETTLTIAQ